MDAKQRRNLLRKIVRAAVYHCAPYERSVAPLNLALELFESGIMKSISQGVVLMLLVTLSRPAHSEQVEKLDAKNVDCKATAITAELAFCADLEYQRLDKQLNKVYAHIMASLDKGSSDDNDNYAKVKTTFLDAQRAWVKFRDADCEAIHLATSGTIASIKYIGCLQDRTKQRTKELEQLDRKLQL